jgi:queuine/archaeosine tRNA-ribosyltransferase
LRAETPPSAAISALTLTVYAIFYGMPVGAMSTGKEQNEIKNIVSYVLRGAPPNNMLHQLFSL